MDVNYGTGEVSLKIVYYGPGLSGKTTNLEVIHSKAPSTHRGRLTAIATQQDRTLFFDFMPLELGKIGGLKTKLRLFTVPGQVFYNSTRKLVLQRVDGVVFIADSQAHKMDENIESLENLEENLREYDVDIRNIPLVIQHNKRDLPGILTGDEINAALNSELKAPSFPAGSGYRRRGFPYAQIHRRTCSQSSGEHVKNFTAAARGRGVIPALSKKKFTPKTGDRTSASPEQPLRSGPANPALIKPTGAGRGQEKPVFSKFKKVVKNQQPKRPDSH